MLASNVVDSGFQSRLDHTKDYKIGICHSSALACSIKEKEDKQNMWRFRSRGVVHEFTKMADSSKWMLDYFIW